MDSSSNLIANHELLLISSFGFQQFIEKVIKFLPLGCYEIRKNFLSVVSKISEVCLSSLLQNSIIQLYSSSFSLTHLHSPLFSKELV